MAIGILIILENCLPDRIFPTALLFFESWMIVLFYELIDDFFLLLLAIAPLLRFGQMGLKIS